MARAITQIEQDIADLEQEVIAIAQELNETYVEYLAVLGEVAQQQVILTTYHLCTQGYPERFLKLSLSERQSLQQELQNRAKQAWHDLTQSEPLNQLTQPFFESSGDDDSDSADDGDGEAVLRNLASLVRRVLNDESQGAEGAEKETRGQPPAELFEPLSDASGPSDDDDNHLSPDIETIIIPGHLDFDFLAEAQYPSSENEDDDAGDDVPDEEGEDDGEDESSSQVLPKELMIVPVETSSESVTETAPPVVTNPTPKALIQRCDRLEKYINSVIKRLNDQVNRLLQKAGILPKKLPDAVLEAALKSDLAGGGAGTPSNLLNLLVETSGDNHKPKMMRIMAIRLRVAELEFNNPTLTAWRSRIRELSAQLQKFHKDYRKYQREKAVAEAEAAWRSIWYEADG